MTEHTEEETEDADSEAKTEEEECGCYACQSYYGDWPEDP
jgi:queuine/archaeosine tRNA-ribosyltransferase